MMGLYLKLYNLINYTINFSVGIIGGFSKKFGEIRYNLPEKKKRFFGKICFLFDFEKFNLKGGGNFQRHSGLLTGSGWIY